MKRVELVLPRLETNDVLINVVGGGAGRDREVDRLVEKVLDDPLNFWRERGGEEEGLPNRRQEAHDEAHVGDEAHVEHPVGFVEDDGRGSREIEHATIDEIFEPAGGADDEVIGVTEIANLGDNARATNATNREETQMRSESNEFLIDLNRQLPRGHHDENALVRILENLVDNGDEEGGGLARAGISDTDDVFAL